jgi:uncharacterized protein YbjT (DUF2867 family)
MQMTIAVAGATGNAGREIVRALASRGVEVRALVRSPERLGDVRDLCRQISVVDVVDPASLRGSLDHADGLISALGKTRQKDKTPRRAVDVDANRNLFAESLRARLKRIALISVAGAAHDHPAVMMRMKADAEDALRETGLPYLIVRPSGYFSDLWEGFEMCRRGIFFCLGNGEIRFNPISLRDLGEFVADRFLNSSNGNLSLSVGGPQVLRMSDVAAISAHILKRKIRVIHVPIWAGKAAVALIKPFSRNLWELGQSFVEFVNQAGTHGGSQIVPPFGKDTIEEYFRKRVTCSKRSMV